MYSKSFLILFLLFPIFGYSETMIINIETKYDDGYAMLGIYDKKNNFGKAKVNEKPDANLVLMGAVVKITNKKVFVFVKLIKFNNKSKIFHNDFSKILIFTRLNYLKNIIP